MPTRRTAEVKHVRSYIPGGLEWSLFLTGDGHWVTIGASSDATAKFRTKDAATRCGAIWVHFGVQPSEQTEEHHARLDAMIAAHSMDEAA